MEIEKLVKKEKRTLIIETIAIVLAVVLLFPWYLLYKDVKVEHFIDIYFVILAISIFFAKSSLPRHFVLGAFFVIVSAGFSAWGRLNWTIIFATISFIYFCIGMLNEILFGKRK